MTKPREKAKRPRVVLSRNESWLQSVKLGFLEAIWWAPTSLSAMCGVPAMALLASSGLLLTSFGYWLAIRFVLLGTGLAGFLSVQAEEAVSEE